MNDDKLIAILKVCIVIGICLLLLGHYLISYTDIGETMGPVGMALSAGCVALGLIFSLPTKMYLTFLLVKRENEQKRLSDVNKKSQDK
jgi:polyferredoxin